ncbi:MAG: hypothetical protein HN976_08830, partial [Lentisphaerae bacterium]|nr:hypothetical protein [Lentisphaerota bacterium]
LVVDNAPPLVTVGFLRTNDTTPPLSGTVNDPSATVQVTVAGVLYPGTVAGQMWSIANDTIASALGEGQHEIVAAATDRAGNTGTDSTTNELTIDLDGPHVLDLSRESSDGTGIDRLVVAFDEALDAGSATDPGNYALDLSGADTTFGNGNETAYAGTIAATYDAGPAGQGPFRVALLLSDKLTGEVYQLTVKGTTSVLDIAGNPLNDGVDEQLQFTVTTPAELQFSEDWESQSLVGPWELHTMDAGAVQLTDANVPLGNWHLVLGDAVGDGTKSLAEATLHVNLAGRENVFVSFQAKGLDGSANAYDPMSDLFNGHEQSDGIAISVDGGVTWYKVWSGQVGTDYAQQEIALDDLLAASSPDAEYSTDTLIRFQNYGDGMAGVDALFIDNIRVNDAFQDPAVTSFTLADPTETASGYTNQRQVDVALTQEADPALSITGWYLSESDSAPAADHGGWLAVMPTTHDLTGPEGAIVVYAWVKDSHDVVSAAEAATIALDKTAPSAPAVNGTTPTGDSTPEWTWTSGGGGGSGAFRQQLDAEEAAGWAETTDTAFTPTEDLSEGTHTLHVQEADAVGNWSLSGSLTITVDATAPNAPVVDGTNPTTDVTPEWTWSSGGGGGSGTFRYQLDSEEGAWVETDQLSFVPDTPFGLGETHVLHVQETDDVGLWSISGNFSIIVVAPLVVGSVTPGPAQGLGTATVVVPGEAQVDESADLAFTVNATGGVAPYHFAWTAGGVPVGGDASVLLYAPGTDAVTHPAISDNKEILCEVTDSWGVVTATATWQIVRVDDVNHVPSMTGVVGVITPSSAEQPTLHDDLLCSLSSPAQDGDLEDLPSMRYRFVWTRGDREVLREIVSWETFDELSYVETAEADEITCTVTAVDQLDVESAGAASATVTIRPPLPGSWELSIGLTNVQVDRVVIGMHERATDGWDSVWDRRTPPTAQGEGYAALEISGEKLSQDFRAIKQYDTFLLRVTSFWESECVLSWDSAAVPGVGLSLEEIGADGEPLGRAASLDMSQEDTLTVPAGHVVFYRIRYGVLRFELELASGWNMFSIPLHPVDTSVEAVLQGQNDGQVWVWDPVQRQYSFASEIVPLRGYWVFCGTQRDGGAATVTVVGRRVDERDVEVTEGWHIVGPVGEVPYAPLSLPLLTVPAGSVQDRPWTWNAELERYDQVDQLRCGRGAWIFSAGPSVIRLGE